MRLYGQRRVRLFFTNGYYFISLVSFRSICCCDQRAKCLLIFSIFYICYWYAIGRSAHNQRLCLFSFESKSLTDLLAFFFCGPNLCVRVCVECKRGKSNAWDELRWDGRVETKPGPIGPLFEMHADLFQSKKRYVKSGKIKYKKTTRNKRKESVPDSPEMDEGEI